MEGEELQVRNLITGTGNDDNVNNGAEDGSVVSGITNDGGSLGNQTTESTRVRYGEEVRKQVTADYEQQIAEKESSLRAQESAVQSLEATVALMKQQQEALMQQLQNLHIPVPPINTRQDQSDQPLGLPAQMDNDGVVTPMQIRGSATLTDNPYADESAPGSKPGGMAH